MMYTAPPAEDATAEDDPNAEAADADARAESPEPTPADD